MDATPKSYVRHLVPGIAFYGGCLLGAAGMSAAAADTLELPAPVLDRSGPQVAIWRPDRPAPGTLDVTWSDGAGRLVERHLVVLDRPVPEVALPLDLRRARVAANRVSARFTPNDGTRDTRADGAFLVLPEQHWPGFQVLLWQDPPGAAPGVLASLGITGTKLFRPASASGQATASRLAAAGLRWYTENLATDFYAAYHRWRPGLPPTWLFDEARARLRRDPDDTSAFHRVPSLSDPAWLASIAARLTEVARGQAPYRPLFHNLGDETGIADLAAAWDFDLSPASLDGMRGWLQRRYSTLDALNRAWGSAYLRWEDVRPALTRDALRDDAAVPSWMDFKAWMDHAFVAAVRHGAAAIHRGDPRAYAALEGGQVPGWGGYDYGLLAPALDVMEIYDSAQAIEIAQSLNPKLRVLTTGFGGADERRRLWRAWLLGARGHVVWDEDGSVVGPDGRPGDRGTAMAPTWRELTGRLGAQLVAMQPAPGEVAILYSQPSFRLTWLLERRADGKDWTERDAEAESAGNGWHAAMGRAASALAGLGAQPRWITGEQLVAGALEGGGTRLVVLPRSVGLSTAEAAALRRFAEGGGMLAADVAPGQRDTSGRPRGASPLDDLVSTGKLRLLASLRGDGATMGEMAGLLADAGVRLPFRVVDPAGSPAEGIEVRLFRDGGLLLAAVLRDDKAAGARDVDVLLEAPRWVRSLRRTEPASRTDRIRIALEPDAPAVLALAAVPPVAPVLSGPATAVRGAMAEFHVAWSGVPAASAQMLDIEVADPTGRVVAETLAVPRDGRGWMLPFALNDPPGRWTVRATDAISGAQAVTAIQLR